MCDWGIVWVISSLCSWEFALFPLQVWKDPPLGFHPISFGIMSKVDSHLGVSSPHLLAWFCCFSSKFENPHKNSPKKIFLQFVGSCEIWLFWSTNLEFGKWIYPSSCFPTFQTLEIALPWKIPMDPEPFIRSQHTPCTRDPVHTGLTYPVRTGHLETFGHFLFFFFLFHHHPSCSSAPFHVFVECSVAISLVS